MLKKIVLISSVFIMAGQTTGFANIQIQRFKTKHDIPVFFYETHEVPMVVIKTAFKAGSAYDNSSYGLSSLTATMLNEGTTLLSATEDGRSTCKYRLTNASRKR
jgi:zinc protease